MSRDEKFLGPDFGSETEKTAEADELVYNKNCEMRARCGNGRIINNFLLDHPLGQLLVSTQLVDHPTLREKENLQRKMNFLAERYHEFTGGRMSLSDAFAEVKKERDFQPKTVAQVILEVHVDKNAVLKRVFWEAEGNKEEYNPNRHIDICYNFRLEPEFLQFLRLKDELLEATVLEELPRVVEERKYVYLRDRFFQLVYDGCWAELADLVYQNHRHPDFREHLSGWLFRFQYTLFNNQHFRREIFRKMMLALIKDGVFFFDSLDKFLQSIGFDMSDPEEKRQLTEQFFPTASLYLLMRENQNGYFVVRDLLQSYGIEPKFG